MVINGELQQMPQHNIAHTTKEFALAGSSPSPHILMLCQELLSLTSDCAGNIGFPYTKSFTQRASKNSTSSFAGYPHIERLFHLGKCFRDAVLWGCGLRTTERFELGNTETNLDPDI